MAQTVEQLQVLITAETSALNSKLNAVTSQLKGLETAASKSNKSITSSLSGLGKSLLKITSITAVVTALTKVGKAAINAASDLAEVQNVVDVAFGAAASEINDFAQNAVTQFGLTEYQAKKSASTLMAMANGMGIAADAGKTMAVQLTGLAADMASFYNVTQDVAETALRSVFTGETEALKKFGVVMTEANLKAFALTKGITKEYSAMSQAEKVALRYNYVLEATQNAQGDFARTSGSWANQVKLLGNQWQSFLSILGQGLIQVLLPMVQVLNTILGYLITLGKQVSQAFNWSSAESSSSALEESVSTTSDDLSEANKNAKKLQNTIGGFDELNVLKGNDSETTASVTVGDIGELSTYFDMADAANEATLQFDALKEKFNELKEAFMNIEGVQMLSNTLGTVFDKVVSNLSRGVGNVKELFSTMFSDIVKTVQKWATPIIDNIAKLYNSIWSDAIGPALDFITKAWADWTQILLEVWNQYGPSILDGIGEFVNNTIKLFKKIWDDILSPIIKPFLELLQEFWDNTLKDILKQTASLIAELIQAALTIYNKFIVPIISWLVDKLKPVVETVSAAIIKVLRYVLEQTSGIISGVIEVLRGVIQFLVAVFTGDWKGAWEAIKNILSGVWDVMKALVQGAVNVIKAIIEGAWNVIKSITSSIWSVIKDVLSSIWSAITSLCTSVWNGIKNTVSNIWNGIKTVIITAATTIRDTVTNAFTTLKTSIVGIFEALKTALKTPLNAIIGFVNKLVSGVCSGINGMINALNRLSFDVPDWVPLIGGKKFGFSLRTITAPQIPYLARGGVITQPTLAMMGEYAGVKSNPEIATPKSLLENIIVNSNSDLANVYISVGRQIISAIQDQNLFIKIGDDTISSAAARGNKNYYNRTGKSQFAV